MYYVTKSFSLKLALSSPPQGPVSDAAQRKARDLVGREMERLRGSVQTVCRSALPLGKIMDYIQEDMDSMQAELLAWRRENQQHAAALQEEQRSGVTHRDVYTWRSCRPLDPTWREGATFLLENLHYRVYVSPPMSIMFLYIHI